MRQQNKIREFSFCQADGANAAGLGPSYEVPSTSMLSIVHCHELMNATIINFGYRT